MLRLWRPLLKVRGPGQSPALPIASTGPDLLTNLDYFPSSVKHNIVLDSAWGGLRVKKVESHTVYMCGCLFSSYFIM